jgi:FAD binding domain-containing protein/aromatic ring hydroxylase-like protein
MGFDVLPPEELIEPVSGLSDLPPLRFRRTERGVFASGAMGSRTVVMTYELDAVARQQRAERIDDRPPMSLAELQESAERVLGAAVPLRSASAAAPLDLRRFTGINSRIAARYEVDRVFLVGDAAHVHSPIGGPGLNLGLQDAVNLGWKLAGVLQGRLKPALLATYEIERRPAAERVIMHSRVQLALFRPGLEVTALRDLFSELITDPDIVGRLSDLLSGADNHYVAGADAHPLVGRWVPDFSVASEDATHRVAELARDGRPVLIDLTDGGLVALTLTDKATQLNIAVGRPIGEVPATAVLVRPDGYVAWALSHGRPDPDELLDLRNVLTRWFGI